MTRGQDWIGNTLSGDSREISRNTLYERKAEEVTSINKSKLATRHLRHLEKVSSDVIYDHPLRHYSHCHIISLQTNMLIISYSPVCPI